MAAGWKAFPQSAHGLPCFKLVYQARNSFCLRWFAAYRRCLLAW